MPVDKFGRIIRDAKRTVVQETTASDLSVTEMNDHFVRRDGSNTVFGSINMMGNTLTNVSNPASDHDVANKAYVDENARGDDDKLSKAGDTMEGDLNMGGNRITGLNTSIPLSSNDAVSWLRVVQLVRDSVRETETKVSKSGDVVSGDLLFSAIGDDNRIIGCNDLNTNRSFSVLLGTSTNKLYFMYFPQQPVTLETEHVVKIGNDDVCQLGTANDTPEIVFHKVRRMNSNAITNLPIPMLPHEAASKLYVDGSARKVLNGYIPPLRSQGSRNNIKAGFIATTNSQLGPNYKASNAFNSYYIGPGPGGEWASNGERRNFWMQITCPDMVRVWKVVLRGRETNTQRIYRWKIEGSTDRENYTTLYEPPDPTPLGNTVKQSVIDTRDKFNHFRLFCIQAEGSNPGLSYMQLFIYSD